LKESRVIESQEMFKIHPVLSNLIVSVQKLIEFRIQDDFFANMIWEFVVMTLDIAKQVSESIFVLDILEGPINEKIENLRSSVVFGFL